MNVRTAGTGCSANFKIVKLRTVVVTEYAIMGPAFAKSDGMKILTVLCNHVRNVFTEFALLEFASVHQG